MSHFLIFFFSVDQSLITTCSSQYLVGKPDEFLSNGLLSLHVRNLTTDKWQMHTTYVTVHRPYNHYPVHLKSSEKFHFKNSKRMHLPAIPTVTWSTERKT